MTTNVNDRGENRNSNKVGDKEGFPKGQILSVCKRQMTNADLVDEQ